MTTNIEKFKAVHERVAAVPGSFTVTIVATKPLESDHWKAWWNETSVTVWDDDGVDLTFVGSSHGASEREAGERVLVDLREFTDYGDKGVDWELAEVLRAAIQEGLNV